MAVLPDIRVSDWGPRIWGGASGGPIPRSCRVEDPEDPEEGLEDPGPLIRGDLRERSPSLLSVQGNRGGRMSATGMC